MEIIFLEPVFKEMPWGGNNLRQFGFNTDLKNIGEAWCISAHEKGDCIIKGGKYDGLRLSGLYQKHRGLFGDAKTETFPLLIKMIDAEDDLSLQVHPGDDYARVNENGSMGKTEFWYILDCKEGAEIIIGHKAKDKSQLEKMIRNAEWGDFINVLPIKKGDYFNITPGTVHAIKGGTMILEIQQNSDLTYRIYDYDRVANGEKRQLHIDKSLDVINAPFNMGECKVGRVADSSGAEHFSCKYYDIWMVPIEGNYTVANSASMLDVVVLGGEGEVNGIKIKKGDAFLIPANFGETKFMGGLEIMLAKAN